MRLSACMIARDEADILGQALANLRGVVDEFVLVDTGSSDDTVAVAAAHGARVLHRPWDGDFSAARNYAIAHARGEWLFVVDCDEMLDGAGRSELARLAAQPPERAWAMVQRNYLPAEHQGVPATSLAGFTASDGRLPEAAAFPGFVPAFQVRLFPRREGVRYEGRVHEDLSPSLAAHGLAVEPCDIVVHHFGKVRDQAVMERKARLYEALSRRKLEENPDDPVAAYEMAVQLLELGREDEAEPVLAQVLRLGGDDWHLGRAQGFLARIEAKRGQLDAAQARLEAALRRHPGVQMLWESLATVLRRRGRLLAASRLLGQARQLFPDDFSFLQQEAELLSQLQLWPEAAAAWARCVAVLPGHRPSRRGRVLAAALAAPDGAPVDGEGLLDGDPEGALALAKALAHAGRPAGARALLERLRAGACPGG